MREDGWEERLGAAIGRNMRPRRRRRNDDGSESSGSDMLHSSEDVTRYKGAKGAAAYEDERLRFTRHPLRRYLDFVRLLKIFLGVVDGQPWRAIDALAKLPCSTYATLKRQIFLDLLMLEFFEKESVDNAKGLLAQSLTWKILQLFVPTRPELCWRMTFQQDPQKIICVKSKESPDLIDSAMQDPRQITAVLGLVKDVRSVLEKARTAGRARWTRPPTDAPTHKGKKGKKGGAAADGAAEEV